MKMIAWTRSLEIPSRVAVIVLCKHVCYYGQSRQYELDDVRRSLSPGVRFAGHRRHPFGFQNSRSDITAVRGVVTVKTGEQTAVRVSVGRAVFCVRTLG